MSGPQTTFNLTIMEVIHINSSVLYVSHRPYNSTVPEKTVYEQCKHMPAVLIWYLVLQFINMILGIPANLTVLWHIHNNKDDSSTSDIFILQLAVIDMLYCLIPPLELANIVFLTTSSTWYVLRFFYGMKDFSPLFLSCICLDQYIAVVHPITFTELKGRHHRTVLAIVVWLIIFVYAAVYCAKKVINFEKVFTVMMLGTLAFMVFCNISILWALRQSGPDRDEMHPVKKRAFKMVLIILAIILFNYFIPVVLFPFQEHFSPDVFRCYIIYIAFGLLNFSTIIQPVLYLSRKKILQSLNCCKPVLLMYNSPT